jgi:hypothetical protein
MATRTVDDLVHSIMLDCWPGMGAMVDFGLDRGDRQQRYEAYYDPIRKGEIKADQLHAVVGDGPALTKLLRGCKHNIHPMVEITTVYDTLKDDHFDAREN